MVLRLTARLARASRPLAIVLGALVRSRSTAGALQPKVLADPSDRVGQVAQLAGDPTSDEPPGGIVVVGPVVAGGQRAFAGQPRAVRLVALDGRAALAEPAVDVLHDAHHPEGGVV
jgi:hypothetical protein